MVENLVELMVGRRAVWMEVLWVAQWVERKDCMMDDLMAACLADEKAG